ncbi:hypothetical protein SAMN05216391_106102, partial [Lachnospiraceae bacterium KHCPX20]
MAGEGEWSHLEEFHRKQVKKGKSGEKVRKPVTEFWSRKDKFHRKLAKKAKSGEKVRMPVTEI